METHTQVVGVAEVALVRCLQEALRSVRLERTQVAVLAAVHLVGEGAARHAYQ